MLKTGAALLAGAALARSQSTAPPKAKITSSVMLWTLKGSFEEKLETAARAGFQSVELIGEYTAWSDADVARIRKTARSFGLGMDTLMASRDWGKRPVSMVDPAQRDAFLADVRNAIGFARETGDPADHPDERQRHRRPHARRAIRQLARRDRNALETWRRRPSSP